MKITPELLKKYAQGTCTSTELLAVETWLVSENEIIKTENTTKLQEERIWNNIKKSSFKTTTKKIVLTKTNIYWSIAASILLLVSLGITHFLTQPSSTIYTTLAQQKQRVILPDGTMVHLNAASELKVSCNFGSNTRSVQLVGEAYFEVKKDSLKPFIIETEISKIEVLGTKFNISAYADEAAILTLHEGKVEFSDRNNLYNNVLLVANEQAILENHHLQKKQVNANRFNGWITNKFYFDNESFLSISKKIERFYAVTIEIENKALKQEIYRGRYSNPTLESLLNDLSFVLQFTYKIEGKTVTIY